MNLLDPLSKVCNQVYLKMHLQSRLEEMRKYRFPIGLLYIDVDGLDSINAKYGREAGDQMLSIVAQTLNRNIRYLDMVGRWKEEEFLAIIFNISENKLEFVADKLRLLVGRISHVSQQMVGKKHGCNEVR